MIRAVVFDAVGTVLHPTPPAPVVYASVAAQFGLAADPAVILSRFRQAYFAQEAIDVEAGWATSEARERARWEAIVRDTIPGSPPECFVILFEHFARPESWAVPADAVPLFALLSARGLALGLASNYDARLERVLAGRPELTALQQHVTISSRIGVRKPGAMFFQVVCNELHCDASEVLYVGDDLENDYDGARAAGLPAVLLDPKDRHPEVPRRVKGLAEVVDYLAAPTR